MGHKKYHYSHCREGELVKVEIKDSTYKLVYRNTFNCKDKNAILTFLKTLEKFSGFSIYGIIQEKLKVGEWW